MAGLLFASVTDSVLRRLRVPAGSLQQWVDSVDVRTHPLRGPAPAAAYRAGLEPAASAAPGADQGDPVVR